MKPFLRWWLIVCLIGVCLLFFLIYNGVNYVNEADFTKISFGIFGIFCYCTIQVGRVTFSRFGDLLKFPRFAVGMMTKMGMTGTVLGFMKMLSTTLKNINVSDISVMQAVLSEMSSGMATALVTTATGLICSILLQLQLFNYDYEN